MKIIFEKKKGDRCTRIAKRKYDVWPSAYASGAVVKCRQGKIWKGLSEEQLTEEILNIISEELEFFLEKKKKKPDFKKEKESSLNGWFSRQGGKGKSKGWVDCNTCRTDKETGKKTCKTCGRQEGEKRAKYPACRPKPSDCDSSGKGTEWGKKSESIELEEGLLEEDRQYLKNIILNELHNIFEVEQLDPKKTATQNVQNAEKIVNSTSKEVQALQSQNSATPTADANVKRAKDKSLEAKRAELAAAKTAVKAAKETAQQATETSVEKPKIAEQKGKFQQYVAAKNDEWKKNLITKGEQEAGVAFPNKAPTARAKSAPPGAGGV